MLESAFELGLVVGRVKAARGPSLPPVPPVKPGMRPGQQLSHLPSPPGGMPSMPSQPPVQPAPVAKAAPPAPRQDVQNLRTTVSRQKPLFPAGLTQQQSRPTPPPGEMPAGRKPQPGKMPPVQPGAAQPAAPLRTTLSRESSGPGTWQRAKEFGGKAKRAPGRLWGASGGRLLDATAGAAVRKVPFLGPVTSAATNYGLTQYGIPTAWSQAFGGPDGIQQLEYEPGEQTHGYAGRGVVDPFLRFAGNKLVPNSAVNTLLRGGAGGRQLTRESIKSLSNRIAPRATGKATQSLGRRIGSAATRKGSQIAMGAGTKLTGPLGTPINAGMELLDAAGLRPQWAGGKGWLQPGWTDEKAFTDATMPDGTLFGEDLRDAGWNPLAADAASYAGASLNAYDKPLRSTWEVSKEVNPYFVGRDIYRKATGKGNDRSGTAVGQMAANMFDRRNQVVAEREAREESPEMYERMDAVNKEQAAKTRAYYKSLGKDYPEPGSGSNKSWADHVAEHPGHVINALGSVKDTIGGWFGS